MRSLSASILFAAIASVCLTIGPVSAQIQYLPGNQYVPKSWWHQIRLVGNKDGYSVTANYYDGTNLSRAQCSQVVANSAGLGDQNAPFFTGQCQASTRKHAQVINIQCINPDNPSEKYDGYATVTLQDAQSSLLSTVGNIWTGYGHRSNPLRKGRYKEQKTHENIGIVVNCYGDSRDD